ncbi:hypothetical protein EZS27_026961 [termite gut metagenome]|uniref:Acyl carrier protein n=1 Tax=termite gut metagenome TaxID=433724 RepID=A0A5J4QNS6_9ZZZZ
MTNKEKYNQVFIECLEITIEQLQNLTYQSIPLWNSVGHMTLMAAIEDSFDIMMEADDIIGFSSYQIGIEILKNKYGIPL